MRAGHGGGTRQFGMSVMKHHDVRIRPGVVSISVRKLKQEREESILGAAAAQHVDSVLGVCKPFTGANQYSEEDVRSAGQERHKVCVRYLENLTPYRSASRTVRGLLPGFAEGEQATHLAGPDASDDSSCTKSRNRDLDFAATDYENGRDWGRAAPQNRSSAVGTDAAQRTITGQELGSEPSVGRQMLH